jgi:hypothetical protein
MKKEQVEIGKIYLALVSGWLCPVKVKRIAFFGHRGFDCQNLSTDCSIDMAPGRLREEITPLQLSLWPKRNDGVRYRRREKESISGNDYTYETTAYEAAINSLQPKDIKIGLFYSYIVPPDKIIPIKCTGYIGANGYKVMEGEISFTGWYFLNMSTHERIQIKSTSRIQKELTVEEITAWNKSFDGRCIPLEEQPNRGPFGALIEGE